MEKPHYLALKPNVMKLDKIYLILLGIILLFFISHIYLHVRVHDLEPPTASRSPTSHGTSTPAASTSTATHKVKGCDVSHWDGSIDWIELKKSGISFIYIKATQGSEYIDPTFHNNWESAQNYGLIRGAYHFYDPHADPAAQADHFLAVIKPQKGDLLPVLDIEIAKGVDPDQLSEDIGIWISKVKNALGRYPIIYTDGYFWNKSISKDFSQCPLWVAEWDHRKNPLMPHGWKDWVFWQYSATGTLAGIPSAKGKVDLDTFNGDLQALKNYQIR